MVSKEIEVGGKEIEGWQGMKSKAGKEKHRPKGERYREMGRINIELGAVDIDSRQTLT